MGCWPVHARRVALLPWRGVRVHACLVAGPCIPCIALACVCLHGELLTRACPLPGPRAQENIAAVRKILDALVPHFEVYGQTKDVIAAGPKAQVRP